MSRLAKLQNQWLPRIDGRTKVPNARRHVDVLVLLQFWNQKSVIYVDNIMSVHIAAIEVWYCTTVYDFERTMR